MYTYRLMALIIALMMLVVIWRERDWRNQFFATLVFIPFVLRAVGVK
jgi:hypothetical protein